MRRFGLFFTALLIMFGVFGTPAHAGAEQPREQSSLSVPAPSPEPGAPTSDDPATGYVEAPFKDNTFERAVYRLMGTLFLLALSTVIFLAGYGFAMYHMRPLRKFSDVVNK